MREGSVMGRFDHFLPTKDYDFMGVRWYCIGASLFVLAMSVFSLVKPGLLWGTDFKGGTEVEIAFKQPVDAGKVRDIVAGSGFGSPDVVAVGGGQAEGRHYLIKVQETSTLEVGVQSRIAKALCQVPEQGELNDPACPKELQADEIKFSPGGDKISARYLQNPCVSTDPGLGRCDLRPGIAAQLAAGKVEGIRLRGGANNPNVQNPREHKVEFYLESKGDQILRGLRDKLGPDVAPDSAERIEWIGPKAGKQLRDAAITSVGLALIFIMVYIAFRFDMRFAPGGVVALFHDVGIAVGAMAAARLEFTLSTVAALLTIVGYSMSDTVVVYDRIRENLGRHRKMTFPAIINRSITDMFRRTIRTSATTFVALVPFLFFGTTVIQDFAFVLIIGVVVGTWSSIYIAAPITEWIDHRFFGASVQKQRRRVVRRGPGGTAPDQQYRSGDAVV
jgi:preprotein translocase subunit SecF